VRVVLGLIGFLGLAANVYSAVDVERKPRPLLLRLGGVFIESGFLLLAFGVYLAGGICIALFVLLLPLGYTRAQQAETARLRALGLSREEKEELERAVQQVGFLNEEAIRIEDFDAFCGGVMTLEWLRAMQIGREPRPNWPLPYDRSTWHYRINRLIRSPGYADAKRNHPTGVPAKRGIPPFVKSRLDLW
jgi:hypothetical protein